MATFSTRVELHDATAYGDYDRLHAAMESEGFSRIIRSDDGVLYRLPTAEYVYSGSVGTEYVLAAAERAAARTGKRHAVFVTEGVNWRWNGLQRAA